MLCKKIKDQYCKLNLPLFCLFYDRNHKNTRTILEGPHWEAHSQIRFTRLKFAFYHSKDAYYTVVCLFGP